MTSGKIISMNTFAPGNNMENTNKELFSYPISHWSFSSMMMFLRNRFAFKKCYILNIKDFKSNPSNIVGKAAHTSLEYFYSGKSVDEAAKAGMDFIENIKDEFVEWGKTGSRVKVMADFTKAFNGYIEEAPKYFKILGVEQSLTTFVEVDGSEFALPLKSVSDLIVENEDESIDIIDHKFVSSYSDGEKDKGVLAFQAMFNYYNVLAEYKKAPKRMIYNEYKISKNSDGSAQLQPYIIEFDKHPEYFQIFHNIYNEVTREISKPDCSYLPNFQDKFDFNEETFKDYKAQLITVENPIVVKHKTGDFKFVEKSFISSPVDIVDNNYLTEEEKIRVKLLEFGIPVEMKQTYSGSSIIQYTLKASRGVKMAQFEKYSSDLALALKAKTIRVLAPIMGTDLVGIEVPNPNREIFKFIDDNGGISNRIKLEQGTANIPIGIDVYGETIVKDLADMPHLLIAGATGQGKSVMINVCVRALAEQNSPSELKFVMIDPKRVELTQFKNYPNIIPPIIHDTDKATKALYWLIDVMESRYEQFENCGVRDIKSYIENVGLMNRIVVVIDEAADLILQGRDKKETASAENAIIRLAQKGRAAGIHLIVGTQRPSVDVISGLLKANFPTRIAFTTSSRTDSQVILDQPGAEELTGKGDMLFLDPHSRGLKRLQGFYA